MRRPAPRQHARKRRPRSVVAALALALAVALGVACAGCASSRPRYRYQPARPPTDDTARDPLGDVAHLVAKARPAIVRVRADGGFWKPFGPWLAGFWAAFSEAISPFPIARAADDLLAFLGYIVVGAIDLESRNGTGIVVTARGDIITNAHVVDRAVEVWVERDDGVVLEVEVVAIAREADLALLRIIPAPDPEAPASDSDDAAKATPVGANGAEIAAPSGPPLAAQRPPFPFLALDPVLPDPGALALVIGYPGRDRLPSAFYGNPGDPDAAAPPVPTATLGIISAVSVDLGHPAMRFIQMDAALNPGNSGGPVLDGHGKVRGVVVARGGTGKESEGYAIPASVVLERFGGELGLVPPAKPQDD